MRMWFIENKMRYFFIAIVSIAFASCSPKEQVDLILHNGTFHSLNANNDTYEAVAIRDGKIVAVGPENEILNGYKSPSIYDMEKKTCLPRIHRCSCAFVGLFVNEKRSRFSCY